MLKVRFYQQLGLLLCFLLTACASSKKPLNPQDPLEPLNRRVYQVNKAIDALYINPIVKVYTNMVPVAIRKLATNFFNNISEVPVIMNNLLQANFAQARDSVARITLNTTLGVGGLFDVASYADLKFKKTDFGTTLYKWGYKKSIYVVLPVLGPTTVRDGIGLFGDAIASVPYHVKSKWRNRYAGAYMVHRKANITELQSFINIAGVDEYIMFRDSYLQNRKYVLGEVNSEEELAEPDK